MSLAGRCECGLLLELVAEDPEPHLACRGEKRCRKCGEVKPVTAFRERRAKCRKCQAAYHRAYIRARLATDPEYAMRHRGYSRRYMKRAYREREGHAERMKAGHRLRYRTDPEYAARVKAYYRMKRLAEKLMAKRGVAA